MLKKPELKFIIEASIKVRNGRLRIFPQLILNQLEEFNLKHASNLNQNSTFEEVSNYFRKCYNDLSILDFDDNKTATKAKFDNLFYPYAYVKD